MTTNTLHAIFQKISMFLFGLGFVFVSIYIPQPVNKIPTAEAAFATVGNQVSQEAVAMYQLAKDTIVASSIFSLEAKEYFLDGLAWAAAKLIISQMTADIVNWINRGFEGSPMFVQDIRRYVTEVGDILIGEYLRELGGLASFVCAPFRVDIQVALNLAYTSARRGYLYGTCTLSGALANIDTFFSGSGAFFEGGWSAWYGVTARPEVYTPYGNLLTAEAAASARIINAEGNAISILEFGEGFFSSKVCEVIFSSGADREECQISSPGQVIEQSLTFQLSSGPRSLIAADEIDEIIGALMAQIAVQVLDGTAGLLGLTSDSGYTQPLTEADIENEEDFGLAGETFADGQTGEQQGVAGRLLADNLNRQLDEFEETELAYTELLDEFEQAIQDACEIGADYGIENLTTNPVEYACNTLPIIATLRVQIDTNLDGDDQIRDSRQDLVDAINDGIDADVIQEEFKNRSANWHTPDQLAQAQAEGESIIMALIEPYIDLEENLLKKLEIYYDTALKKCDEATEESVRADMQATQANLDALYNLRLTLVERGPESAGVGPRGPQAAVDGFIALLPDAAGGVLHTPGDVIEMEEAYGPILTQEPPVGCR